MPFYQMSLRMVAYRVYEHENVLISHSIVLLEDSIFASLLDMDLLPLLPFLFENFEEQFAQSPKDHNIQLFLY